MTARADRSKGLGRPPVVAVYDAGLLGEVPAEPHDCTVTDAPTPGWGRLRLGNNG